MNRSIMQSQQREARPNPSLRPTCYSWLRQPTQAGELKRVGGAGWHGGLAPRAVGRAELGQHHPLGRHAASRPVRRRAMGLSRTARKLCKGSRTRARHRSLRYTGTATPISQAIFRVAGISDHSAAIAIGRAELNAVGELLRGSSSSRPLRDFCLAPRNQFVAVVE